MGAVAAADRSRVARRLVGVAGVAAIGLLAAAMAVGGVPTTLLPWLVFGLGVASGLDRLVFDVVRPLPDLRRRRTEAD